MFWLVLRRAPIFDLILHHALPRLKWEALGMCDYFFGQIDV